MYIYHCKTLCERIDQTEVSLCAGLWESFWERYSRGGIDLLLVEGGGLFLLEAEVLSGSVLVGRGQC